MKTKVILFLFVFGAVAILAEKVIAKKNEKEDDLEPQVAAVAYVDSAKKTLQSLEDKIRNTTKELQESLRKELQSAGNRLKTEKEKAKEEGKGEDKIQDCLNKLELNLRGEMKNDTATAEECFEEATEELKKTLEEAEKALAKIFGETSGIQRSTHDNYGKINGKVSEFNPILQKVREALDEKEKEMNGCFDDFRENLKQVEDAYSTFIIQCKSSK